MEKETWKLLLASKQLQSKAKSYKREEKKELEKLKKSLEVNEVERARIHAANAILKKNESLNTLALSSRIDALASKLNTTKDIKNASRALSSAGKEIDKAIGKMDLTKFSTILENLEKQMQDTETRIQYIDAAVGNITQKEVPNDQVESLLCQTAEKHHLDITNAMPHLDEVSLAEKNSEADKMELMERLMRLKDSA